MTIGSFLNKRANGIDALEAARVGTDTQLQIIRSSPDGAEQIIAGLVTRGLVGMAGADFLRELRETSALRKKEH